MVTPATTEALVVVYAPAEISAAQMKRVLEATASRMADIVGGHETGRTSF